MPSTNDSRAIKITASTGSVTASDFDIHFTAAFDASSAVTLTFSDDSDKTTDKTIHGLRFADAATGETIAEVSIRVRGLTKLLNDFSADVAFDARSDTTPTPTGPASQLRNPQNSNLRRWAQPVADAGGNVLRNIAVVDVRSKSGTGTATQTIVTNDDTTFLMNVDVAGRAGSLASGTITLTTGAVVAAGYTLGNVVITDTEDDEPAERRVLRR